MLCCWSYWWWHMPIRCQSWLSPKLSMGNGNDHKGGTSQGDYDLEAGPLQYSHVWVTPASPQMHKGDQNLRKGTPCPTTSDPIAPRGFHLHDIQECIQTTWQVTILPCGTMARQTSEGTGCRSMCLQSQPRLPTSIVPAATYEELLLGSSWVFICLMNLGACPFVVPAKVIVRNVTPASQLPLVTLLTVALGGPASGYWKDWILDELNLQGLEDWPKNDQRQARELLTKWEHLFAHSNLDMGKASLIKHQIELTDWTPFKECYWQIPPHVWWCEGPSPGDAGHWCHLDIIQSMG